MGRRVCPIGGQHPLTLPQGVRPGLAGVPTRPARLSHPWGATSGRKAAPLTHLGQGLGAAQVLCDPWLVGSLTFGGLPWLYEGKKDTSGLGMAAADGTDILLLSQARDRRRTRCLAQCDSDASTHVQLSCVRHRG